jgi:hypothetical protein
MLSLFILPKIRNESKITWVRMIWIIRHLSRSVCDSACLTLLQERIQLSPLCCIESIHVLRTWAPDARPSTWQTTVHLLHDQALCSSRAVHPPPTATDIADCRVWTPTLKIRSNRCVDQQLCGFWIVRFCLPQELPVCFPLKWTPQSMDSYWEHRA